MGRMPNKKFQDSVNEVKKMNKAMNAWTDAAIVPVRTSIKLTEPIINNIPDYIRDYLKENHDHLGAILMANRTGMLSTEIQIPKLLEFSKKAKERFKLIYDTQSFEIPS